MRACMFRAVHNKYTYIAYKITCILVKKNKYKYMNTVLSQHVSVWENKKFAHRT